MRTRFLQLHALALMAAGLEACGDAGPAPDAGMRVADAAPSSSDAQAEGARDASPSTSHEDAGTIPVDAALGTGCGLAETFRFSWAGGFRGSRDLYTVTPPSGLIITRVSAQGADDEAGDVLCSVSFTCGGAGVDAAALIAALSGDEVAAAFQATPTLYGSDPRVLDGAVLRVSRMDGSLIEIGSDCAEPAAGCNPVTSALRALADQLAAFMEAVRPGDAGQCATGP